MKVQIAPYTAEFIERVRMFNERISTGGWGEYQLPLDPGFLDRSREGPLPWDAWLALDAGEVRGGYLARRQQFSFDGDVRTLAFYNLSLSEGVVDKRYAPVSMKMAASAVSNYRHLFALGMGGLERRLPLFLKALGWSLYEIPFLFFARRPGRVLRNIDSLRSTPWRRAALDIAAFTGAAWAAVGLAQALRKSGTAAPEAECAVEREFGSWADEVWASCGGSFSMIGVRNSAALNALYPPRMARISRLRISLGGKPIGWAVTIHTRMSGDRRFGDLHVGALVDCLARHEDARTVAQAAARFLMRQDVDLIVSNQSHGVWVEALRGLGFLNGPSNYVLAVSKPLAAMLDPFQENVRRAHITRGDGDGPIHL